MCSYLKACPSQGNATAAVILPNRRVTNGIDERSLSSWLRLFNLMDEADTVDCTSGKRWMSRARSFTLDAMEQVGVWGSTTSSSYLKSKSKLPKCSFLDFIGFESVDLTRASCAVRALGLFIDCGDGSRACAIVESAFTACVACLYAVAAISREIYPDSKRRIDIRFFNDLVLSSPEGLPLLDIGVGGAESIMSAVGTIRNIIDLLSGQQVSDVKFTVARNLLGRTLENSRSLLDSVHRRDSLYLFTTVGADSVANKNDGYCMNNICVCLTRYIEAVELFLISSEIFAFDLSQLQNNPDDFRRKVTLVEESRRKASLLLSGLLTSDTVKSTASPLINDSIAPFR